MARRDLPSVKDVAAQVLRSVEAEGQIKQAERQLLRGALNPKTKTDLGFALMKLASQCRSIDDEDPEVTHQDLINFMGQCHAK